MSLQSQWISNNIMSGKTTISGSLRQKFKEIINGKKYNSSAPVYSLYYIAIDTEAGITSEQFETFVQQKGVYIPCYPGRLWTLLRGLRGERVGQYLMLFEIESLEQRNRYLTNDGNKTELARKFWQQQPQNLMLFEIESLEQRNRYLTNDGNKTELARKFWQQQPQRIHEILAEWQRYGTFSELPTIYTDYQLLAENKKSTVTYGPRYLERPSQEPITRIIGIHNLALRAGIKPETFETFIAENHPRIEDYSGWKFRLLKGEHGNHLDQYVVMMEIEDLATLNLFYPKPDTATDEANNFALAHQDTDADV